MLRILEMFAGTLVSHGLGVGSYGRLMHRPPILRSPVRLANGRGGGWRRKARTRSNDVEKRTMQRSLMLSIAAVALATILSVSPARLAQAQTPIDGRIVRVVYQVGGAPGAVNPTWGFHLAHMKDGRYCVRLGNPGRRLSLAIIEEVADICFDRVPATVDRSPERRYEAVDTDDGRTKTFIGYQKGSIAASRSEITIEIASCSRLQEGGPERHCFPNRYVIRLSGQGCSAEVTLFRGKPGATTCEHYAAQ